MFVEPPVELAKPNLKVGGIAPFTVTKFGMLIIVSLGTNTPSLFESKATVNWLVVGCSVI